MSDYLFDKAGEADPEIERLEALMAPLAYRGAAPALPRRRPRRTWIAAATLTTAAAALVALLLARPWRPRPPTWAATVRDGSTTRAMRLPVGEWLDTGGARVRLVVADIGTVELAAGTRARIVATTAARHEMELQRGTLVAAIDAPPRHFVVDTPRAVVTDLGCAFELTVDESGRGRLVVTAGKVALQSGDAPELVVPAGGRVELSEHAAPSPPLPSTPTPSTPPPSTPTPSTPTPIAPPPHHHVTAHATKPAAHAHASKKPTPPPATHPHPQPHAAPAKKDEAPRIEHDALKALQQSGE